MTEAEFAAMRLGRANRVLTLLDAGADAADLEAEAEAWAAADAPAIGPNTLQIYLALEVGRRAEVEAEVRSIFICMKAQAENALA